jgi:hypothetical protein
LLEEHKISREKFDKALELYGNDGDILEQLENITFEASKGMLPKENIAEEVLRFELEQCKNGKSIVKKYLLEDEVWEKWGVEIGDVHQVAKNSKNLKQLYLQIRSII